MKNKGNLATGIGFVVFNFSTLDIRLSAFVSRLVTEDSVVGAIVTSEMSFSNKIAAFNVLCDYHIKDQSTLEDVRKMVIEMRELEAKRNQTLHSVYIVDNPQPDAPVYRMKLSSKQNKGLKIDKELIEENHFLSFQQKLLDVTNDLMALYKRIYPNEPMKLASAFPTTLS